MLSALRPALPIHLPTNGSESKAFQSRSYDQLFLLLQSLEAVCRNKGTRGQAWYNQEKAQWTVMNN